MIDAPKIDAQPLLAARSNRVEEPDPFDITPAARRATIRYYDMIEGALDRAATRESNNHHSEKPWIPENAKAARWAAPLRPAILLSCTAQRKPRPR